LLPFRLPVFMAVRAVSAGSILFFRLEARVIIQNTAKAKPMQSRRDKRQAYQHRQHCFHCFHRVILMTTLLPYRCNIKLNKCQSMDSNASYYYMFLAKK